MEDYNQPSFLVADQIHPPILNNLHTVPHYNVYITSIDSPVFICEAGAVRSHSELAKELTEPFLDLDPLLSAFIHAGSLSTSEAVAVVHSRVVEARHSQPGRRTKRLEQKENT